MKSIYNFTTVLGLCGGFDVPDNQLFAQSLGNGLSQHGFSGTRLALNEQRLLQHHGNIGSPQQFLRGHIILTSLKFLHVEILPGPGAFLFLVPHCIVFLWKIQAFFLLSNRSFGYNESYLKKFSTFSP